MRLTYGDTRRLDQPQVVGVPGGDWGPEGPHHPGRAPLSSALAPPATSWPPVSSASREYLQVQQVPLRPPGPPIGQHARGLGAPDLGHSRCLHSGAPPLWLVISLALSSSILVFSSGHLWNLDHAVSCDGVLPNTSATTLLKVMRVLLF